MPLMLEMQVKSLSKKTTTNQVRRGNRNTSLLSSSTSMLFDAIIPY
jgi:hypothetical protein